MPIFRFFLFAFSFFFFACSDNSSSSVKVFFDEEFDGFVKIKGEKIALGTDEANAPAAERPQMSVVLDYDFSIAISEVTCKEFNALMDFKTPCENENFPAVHVTFWDAVLFANEKSKRENLDTVYTYTNATFNENKNCTFLEGYGFSPETKGFRLPTEAEWILAAQKFNTKNAWSSQNSAYQVHEVCTSGKNANGLCDMAGNVMEWVNDWKVYFRDEEVVNFTGGIDGGNLGERILKGGSFKNDPSSMNVYSRGDVYTVTSSTKADYVGFRLALGKIPNPTFLNAQGALATSNWKILTSTSKIKNLLGTYRSKLVFRNDLTGNLSFIDFNSASLSVKEIDDTLEVYHPEISPDGNWVAFSTKFEGVEGNSELYVRKLNETGEALTKLDVKSAAIPRWKIEGNDTLIIYVTSAGINTEESIFKSYETWKVNFKNGKFGSPQKLFDGNFHGGISENLSISGARLLRVRLNDKDTIWYNAEQACNASLNKNNQTLFLDFASETGKNFVGSPYRVHERLFIMDSTGNILKALPAPTNYAFDFSEWVDERFAVVALTNANGAHTKIALVNTADSSITEIIEGEELWHPSLWVKEKISGEIEALLDLDSAGVYLTEEHETEQSKYRVKMELYWKTLDSTEIILIGSSRMEQGAKADLILERKMLNMGVMGIVNRTPFSRQ